MTPPLPKSLFTGIVYPLPMVTLPCAIQGAKSLPTSKETKINLRSCDCPFVESKGSGQLDSIYVAIYNCKNRPEDTPENVRVVHIVACSTGLEINTQTMIDTEKFGIADIMAEAERCCRALLESSALQERDRIRWEVSAPIINQ